MKFETLEKYLLALLIAVLIFPVWYLQYFSTMDGPSHLENSVNVYRLLSGECPLTSHFYHLTAGIVPNWLGHAIMGILAIFIKPIFAEKILITLYLIFLPLSALSLLKSINHNSTFLIFPILIFAYNNVLFSGNYNCLLSIILYFYILRWWLTIQTHLNLKNTILLSTAFLLLYLTHFFGLSALCSSIAVIYIYDFILQPSRANFTRIGKNAITCTLALAPTLIAFSTYFMLPKMVVAGYVPLAEKLTSIFIPTTLYIAGSDKIILLICACLLWIFTSLLIVNRITNRLKLSEKDWPLIIAITFGLAIVFIPSTFGGGWMIERRLELTYWLFLIFWLANFTFSKPVKLTIIIISLLIFATSYGNKFIYLAKYSDILTNFATVEDHIPENSTIFAVDISPYTVDYKTGQVVNRTSVANITGYITADKCVAEVSDFHASEKNTFPISYKDELNPYDYLGKFRTEYSLPIIPPQVDIAKYESATKTKIDYIIIRGKNEFMYSYEAKTGLDENKLYTDFMRQVNADFKLIYTSPDSLARVYKAN